MERERVTTPYFICPRCGFQLIDKPDIELFIDYVPMYGAAKTPVIRVHKALVLNRADTETEFLDNLRRFLIKVGTKKPVLATIPHTHNAKQLIRTMLKERIINDDEIMPFLRK